MTLTLASLLALVGVICLFAAGFNVVSPRLNFGWLGLAFLALAWLVLNVIRV